MDDLSPWRAALKSFAELHDIFDSFERYLIPDSAKPLSVAVSGGGDSVALLHLLHLWGKRPLEVFCVDHGLNPSSSDWCTQVERLARRLGCGFSKLDWTGDKPATGIQAAARQARHRLLADAARAKGIEVLCLGHNCDDVLEAVLMRDMGSTVGAPAMWSPSPVWPQGRGLFIYRPLLTVRRQVLRDWLRAIGVDWIDDPANENLKYLRSKARGQLGASQAGVVMTLAPGLDFSRLMISPQPFEETGILTLNLTYYLNLETPVAHKVIAAAMVSAGGGERLPRSDSLSAIYAALMRGEDGPFTLSGARLIRLGDVILIGREHGDMVRRNVGPLDIAAHTTAIWDGRFEITAGAEAVTVMAAQGFKSALCPADLARFLQVPSGFRAALPVAKTGHGTGKALVLLAERDNSTGSLSHSWVKRRFLNALGFVTNEYDLRGFCLGAFSDGEAPQNIRGASPENAQGIAKR